MTNDTQDQELRDALARTMVGQRLPLEGDPVAATWRRVDRRRRQRRAVAGTGLLGLALVATSVVVLARNDGDTDKADHDVATERPIVSDPDGVEVFPEPPLNVRGDGAVVWTGAELVVWGGEVEASNMGLPGPDGSTRDGAAFAPATGTWRELAPAPLPDTDFTPVGVMTDGGVLIVRGRAAALWSPEDDTWRELDDAPADVEDLASNGSVAMSYSANAALDVETGQWRDLPTPPDEPYQPTTAWTGRELVVVGGSGSVPTKLTAVAYNPGSNQWRRLPQPPGEVDNVALSADWDGERVVVVNYDMHAVTYDPATDSWEEPPAVPVRFRDWYPTLRSAGGTSVAFMADAVAVLSADNRWVPLPYGDLTFGTSATTRPAAVVEPASDGTVFVWGIDAERGVNVLTGIDLDRLVAGSSRVQVGAASVELLEGFVVADASYSSSGIEEEVRVVIANAETGQCTVTSAYREEVATDQPIEETLQNDGEPTSWARDEAGRTWQTAREVTMPRTAVTPGDLVTVECDHPDAAEALAKSASFGL